MILVRDVFQLKFGKAKEAIDLMKEAQAIANSSGATSPFRVCTDLTGPYYTLVLESTYENLSAYEQDMHSMLGNADWKAWYQRFQQLAESGHREMYTIVS